MRTTPLTKYALAFLITGIIFSTAIIANNFFNDKRLEQLRAIEESISIDILSLETQFDLLQEQSCTSIAENPILSRELDSLANKLSFAEAQLGVDNPEVISLKRHYSLLEIKDLLLMQKISDKCGLTPVFLLYFYSNEKGSCVDCKRQGYVLTELARKYPSLRIYSFDYNLDLSAIETLIALKKIPAELPALVIHDVAHGGFKTVDEVETLLPELAELKKTEDERVEGSEIQN